MDVHPVLTSTWTMHFRLGLDKPFEESPKRRIIIRQHLHDGHRDMTCWALLCEGVHSFLLVYGEHNMDEGKAEVAFRFDPTKTDPTHFNLVALQVNATHGTMMLQDGAGERVLYEGGKPVRMPGVNTQPLNPGTMPTECAGGAIEIGDLGLQLAGFEYHPGSLTDIMVGRLPCRREGGRPGGWEIALGKARRDFVVNVDCEGRPVASPSVPRCVVGICSSTRLKRAVRLWQTWRQESRGQQPLCTSRPSPELGRGLRR